MDKTRITNANKQHARRSAGAGEIKEINMSDLIDRQAVIGVLYGCTECKGRIRFDNAVDGIKKLPPAQPERIKGHWVNGRCDKCNAHAPFWCMASTYHESNFCPNCGAEMEVTT